MHLIDTAGNVDGQFVPPDPLTGQQPVRVDSAWLNDVQNNIVAVLTAAGVPPTKGDAADLVNSINDLIAAAIAAEVVNFTGDTGSGGVHGLVPAPAAGDAAAGKVLAAGGSWSTLAALFGVSLGVNGHITLGGWIINWGTSSSLTHGASQTVSFSKAFTTPYGGAVNASNQDSTAEASCAADTLSTGTMIVTNTSFVTQPVYWIAWGA